jgi:hypothetical protein
MAPRTRRAALAQSVGYVGYQKTIANIANILHSSRPDAVGIANNANTVRLLHELTIVSLLHELRVVAASQVAGGVGGEGPGQGANGNGAFTHKFF